MLLAGSVLPPMTAVRRRPKPRDWTPGTWVTSHRDVPRDDHLACRI